MFCKFYRRQKHITNVLQDLNRSHKHITRCFARSTEVKNTSTMFCKILTEVTNTSPDVLQDLNRSHKHITRCFARSTEVKNTSTMFCKILTEVTNISPDVLQVLQKSKTHHRCFARSIKSHKHIDVLLQDFNKSHKHITRCFTSSTEAKNTSSMFCKIYRNHKHITDVLQVPAK